MTGHRELEDTAQIEQYAHSVAAETGIHLRGPERDVSALTAALTAWGGVQVRSTTTTTRSRAPGELEVYLRVTLPGGTS